MFCSNCGTQLPDGSQFCSKCDTKMGDVSNTMASDARASMDTKSKESDGGIIAAEDWLVEKIIAAGGKKGLNADELRCTTCYKFFKIGTGACPHCGTPVRNISILLFPLMVGLLFVGIPLLVYGLILKGDHIFRYVSKFFINPGIYFIIGGLVLGELMRLDGKMRKKKFKKMEEMGKNK